MTGKLPIFGLALALVLTSSAEAGVVKTKTKSNQSNDRIAQTTDLTTAVGDTFDSLDTDRDGQLNAAEQAGLTITVPAVGEEARGAPLKGVDVKIGRGTEARSVRITFSSRLDADGNGLIGKGEWMDDWQSQLTRADTNHDGTLSEAEATRFGWNIKSTEAR